MEESIASARNRLTLQPERIKPEELEYTIVQARKRAIEARQLGTISSVPTFYDFGGWSSLFEEYVEQRSTSDTILQEPEISDAYGELRLGKNADSVSSVETPTSADYTNNLSQKSDRATSSEASPSIAASEVMPLCPSGRPDAEKAVIFGVVGGTVTAPKVGYLTESIPVNADTLALSGSVESTEIFRVASTCAGNGCQHFDGSQCRLAMRIVEQLPTVVEALPACQIRPHCRWWKQEGKAACLRCPQVVTDNYYASEVSQQVAKPN